MTLDVSEAAEELRQLVAKADALAYVTGNVFEDVVRVRDVEDTQSFERLAHLVGATAEAVENALDAAKELAARLCARTGAWPHVGD